MYTEQEMDRRLQEHQQELESLTQDAELSKHKLKHEASLKREAAEVSCGLSCVHP